MIVVTRESAKCLKLSSINFGPWFVLAAFVRVCVRVYVCVFPGENYKTTDQKLA